MTKNKQVYICLNCQNDFLTWSGKCPSCGQWNTLTEQKTTVSKNTAEPTTLVTIANLKETKVTRYKTGLNEFDRVLGGDNPGYVVGSVILLAGSPGVGKSTLLLQASHQVKNAIYFSAEESLEQLKIRFDRLELSEKSLRLSSERDLSKILATLAIEKPPLAIIDSVQTVYDDSLPGTPGSIVQVKEATWRLQCFAKESGTTLIVVGHVTKEGMIAGPKTLEHLVDVVLYLEGEKRTGLRILRPEKNRFGSTDEVGIWQLTKNGMTSVSDPGRLFSELITDNLPGRAISVTLEGSRVFLIEIQALVSKTAFGYPKRMSQGIDSNRLNVILAVIENRLEMPLSQYDVFINVVGGFSIKDPGVDLAIASAILSSLTKRPINKKSIFVGEIGLLGEVRPAVEMTKREREAQRLGYAISKNVKSLSQLKAVFLLKEGE